jgi:hypothetical protein
VTEFWRGVQIAVSCPESIGGEADRALAHGSEHLDIGGQEG